MNYALEEQYLTWLYSHIGSVKLRNSAKTHWLLAKQLYSKEFLWFIANDDNRVEDGRGLRYEFINETEVEDVDSEWLELPCSMLELLIGLSRRLSFEAEGEPRVWFWHLIEILDLEQYNDRDYNDDAYRRIDEALDNVIWRTYSRTGKGGLFPLRRPRRDQREVELWYQMSSYLIEHD